jgi:tetratricopeptide (TPR) repeat protein
MTRLPREWVASLALSVGLLIGGCSRGPSAPIAQQEPGEQAESSQLPAAPPQLFAVPANLAPLPSLEPPRTDASTQPVQAQYAQTAPAPQPPVTSPANQSIYAPQPASPQLASRPAAGPPAQHNAEPAIQQSSSSDSAAQQVAAMTERATQMARKGMLFAAKNELLQALQLVAQARDVHERTAIHVAALSAGLTALQEADDFSPEPGRDPAGARVVEIVSGHRTQILRGAGEISPVVAQQHYYAFAQQELAQAAAGEPAASQALYTLGKIQMALAGPASPTQSLHGPRAMVFHQAALVVDYRNYRAANELGVLLARYGQLPEARRALLHSVTIQPNVEGWHNLATVHRRLGETELAQLAEVEYQLLAAKHPADADKLVNWVDPRTFASSDPQGPGWHAPSSTSAARPSNPTQRR